MIVGTLLLAMAQAKASIRDATASFIQPVKGYTTFVTPHCAPEIVNPYRNFNRGRDGAFFRSLKNTPLEGVYRTAVQEQRDQDEKTVFECFGPPPPPPPPGTPPPSPQDPRSRAIAAEQKRLRSIADDMPGYFDQGDVLFARMIAARDQLVGKGAR